VTTTFCQRRKRLHLNEMRRRKYLIRQEPNLFEGISRKRNPKKLRARSVPKKNTAFHRFHCIFAMQNISNYFKRSLHSFSPLYRSKCRVIFIRLFSKQFSLHFYLKAGHQHQLNVTLIDTSHCHKYYHKSTSKHGRARDSCERDY
jgi:hypothetical protein